MWENVWGYPRAGMIERGRRIFLAQKRGGELLEGGLGERKMLPRKFFLPKIKPRRAVNFDPSLWAKFTGSILSITWNKRWPHKNLSHLTGTSRPELEVERRNGWDGITGWASWRRTSSQSSTSIQNVQSCRWSCSEQGWVALLLLHVFFYHELVYHELDSSRLKF